MKIAIDPGHNLSSDIGASGIKREDELIMSVVNHLIPLLENKGHEVLNVLPEKCTSVINSLQQRVSTANNWGVDVFCSIHFNAYNGSASGSEVFYVSASGKKFADKILKEIVKLGFVDRGVKQKGFYVLNNTSAPAVLVECCFCDSSQDMSLFNAEDMANAILIGLTT